MKGNSHSRLATNIMVPQLERIFLEDDIVSFSVGFVLLNLWLSVY
jgi:hypothetical protein